MLKFNYFLFFLFAGLLTKGQVLNDSISIDSSKTNNKYLIWGSPSKATHVHGIMFNVFPKTMKSLNGDLSLPTINGIEFNINPISAFLPFIYLMYSMDPNVHKPLSESLNEVEFDSFKKVNGIELAFLNMEQTIINGIDINIAGSHESKTNGVSISGIINKHYVVNGLTIGLIGNHDIKCNGVQIGLINSSNQLKGLQFGLWNKNQKRSFPIINWAFKK